MRVQTMIREFHEAFGGAFEDVPTRPDPALARLRDTLIREEAKEVHYELHQFHQGSLSASLSALAKELADLLYVVYGTADACGIDLDAVFVEVHSSNMSKLGEDGEPIKRGDGKVLKGPNYREPDVEAVLDIQRILHETGSLP